MGGSQRGEAFGVGEVRAGEPGTLGLRLGEPVGVEEQGGAGVVEDVADAFGRVVGVERHVSGTGLEHGQQRDGQVEGAGQADGHQGFGAGAAGHERPGEPVGAGVEPGVGEVLPLEEHGGGVRGAGGLGLDQLRGVGVRHGAHGVVHRVNHP